MNHKWSIIRQLEKLFTDLFPMIAFFSMIIISCVITLQIKNYSIWLRLEVISESARTNLLKNYVRHRIYKSIFFLNRVASGSFGHTLTWMHHGFGPAHSKIL